MKRMFCLMVGVLLLGRPVSGAQSVVWSGKQDIQIGPGWLSSLLLDVNADGVNDLGCEFFMDFVVKTQNGSGVTVQPQPPFGILDAVPLGFGAEITPSSQWGMGTYPLIDWEVVPGYGWMGAGSWSQTTNGYLGVSFAAADGVHYGWLRMTVSGEYPSAVIHDWAYESQPGVSIMAGVVPEPSTLGLFVVGALIGVFSRRIGVKPTAHN